MKLLWIFALLTVQYTVQAQDSLVSETLSNQKELRDLFSKSEPKARVKPLRLSWAPGGGYSLQTGFAIVVGANIGFHTAKGDRSKLSSVLAGVTYSQYNQTIVPIMANIWSPNGKWDYSLDWRFMQYPSQTWGLSGRDPNYGFSIDFSYIKLHQTVLKSITRNLFVGTGLLFDDVWNIRQLSGLADSTSSFQLNGLGHRAIALAIPFRLIYDSRLNQINPSHGSYISLTLRANLQSLGSTQDWQSIVLDLRKYFRVSESGNTLAFWFYSWQSSAQTPYLLLPSTGWDNTFNTGRGYIQGKFRSNVMHYIEMEYRFRITRNGILGGAAFANLQDFSRTLTSGPFVTASGVGAGLRIKINKRTGANLCIDYAFGQDGSRGFFLNLGEVF